MHRFTTSFYYAGKLYTAFFISYDNRTPPLVFHVVLNNELRGMLIYCWQFEFDRLPELSEVLESIVVSWWG